MAWSDKYLGIPWQWGGCTLQGCDCLGVTKLILKNEIDYTIPEDSPCSIGSKYRMIEQAIKQGDVIKAEKDLKEFDVVFFIVDGEVRHMGVMIDKFGRFIHQLEGKVSRVSKLSESYWQKRFFVGIRNNERTRKLKDI